MMRGLLRNTIFATVAISVASGWTQLANAATMSGAAYEPFNYATGTQLVASPSANNGVGWNTTGNPNSPNDADANWANAIALPAPGGTGPAKAVQNPGLSYTAIGYPATTGGKAVIDATLVGGAGQTNNVSRNFKQTVDAGTFWFSYLTDKNNDTHRTTSLAFFGPTNAATRLGNVNERVSIGQIGTGTAGNVNTMGNFALLINNQNPANVAQAATPLAYGVGVTHLVVGRIEFNNGAAYVDSGTVSGTLDTLTVWIDPTNVTSVAALGTPYISTANYELTSIHSIRLFSGNQAAAIDGAPIKPPVSTDFDEIRIAGTLAEAVGIIPEPGAVALAAIGIVLFGCGLRRRIAA